MPDITIKEVSEQEIRQFVDFQYALYKNDPYWIGDLKSANMALLSLSHPFWKHGRRKLFMAWRGDKPVARVAAIVNDAHNAYHKDKTGFFGFFETLNDMQAAHAILSAAADWLKTQGMDTVRGPMNPSTNESCGLLVAGFDSAPKIMMPYNPPFYSALLEEFGFKKAQDLQAYIRFSETGLSDRIAKIIGRIESRKDWKMRDLRLSVLEHELEVVREIYNESWAENWGFIPITPAEMAFTAKELRPILKPWHGQIIEVDNKPAAFSLFIPDINSAVRAIDYEMGPIRLIKFLLALRNVRQGRLILLGVKKEFRNRGFELALIKKVVKSAQDANWLHGELSWVLEDNKKMITVIEECGGRLYKRYRVYDLPLGNRNFPVPL